MSPSDAAPLPILNVAAYRFVPLDELPALRARLLASAQLHGLKGTVLLAQEGINLVLAGAADGVRAWLSALREDPRFQPLTTKDSWSADQPFQRLKVKVKAEIIRMNQPTVTPAAKRAPVVAPATLARWLAQGHDDQGRRVLMLDTRNAFEVDDGAFEGALDWRLQRFSDFPAALAAQRSTLGSADDTTVVSYCTGGIRCEKAALWMQAQGLPQALQLDGGILGYFEATGGAAPGWRGRCFVFDQRVGLATDLAPA